jgi:hypothetical protein
MLAAALVAACGGDARPPADDGRTATAAPTTTPAPAGEEPLLAVTGAPPLNQQVAEPREAPGRGLEVTVEAVTATGGEARVVAANRTRSRFAWRVTLTNQLDAPYRLERLDVELVDRDGRAVATATERDIELRPREARVVAGELLVPAAAVARVHAVKPVLR